MLRIGNYNLPGKVLLAPMAGITDLPFRRLCLEHGAALAATEMLTSDPSLWQTKKSHSRTRNAGIGPHTIQLAGNDASTIADAAARVVDMGADIVDLNMGCPAKKVCKRAAGSALMKEPAVVAEILAAVVNRVNVPVTLKTRTGWSPDLRNGVEIARIAEDCGVAAITMHGRTRACRFNGSAEYDTIAQVKQAVSIPVIANGDIDSEEKAKKVLQQTGADAIMLGRASQGRPWLFSSINAALAQRDYVAPTRYEKLAIAHRHLTELHDFYGAAAGIKIARKHIACYLEDIGESAELKRAFYALECSAAQTDFIDALMEGGDGSGSDGKAGKRRELLAA